MTLKGKIIMACVIALLIIAAGSAIYAWYAEWSKPRASRIEYVKVPEIKEVIKIKRVSVPGPERIITIEKEVIVEKLKLPDWVKTDANKQVIATAEIQPHDGITNAAAIMDMKTGASEIIAKQLPPAFMAFENKKELGMRVGYSTDEWSMRSTVYGRWSFARIGKVHLGLYAEANSRGEGIGQIDLSYRF